MPEPPPTGSPDLNCSRVVVPNDDDLGSNPDMIDDVGETLPFRPANELAAGFADDWGYRLA